MQSQIIITIWGTDDEWSRDDEDAEAKLAFSMLSSVGSGIVSDSNEGEPDDDDDFCNK